MLVSPIMSTKFIFTLSILALTNLFLTPFNGTYKNLRAIQDLLHPSNKVFPHQ